MIIDLHNLNKDQQNKLDEIYHQNQNKFEELIYSIIKKDKSDTLLFSNLIGRNPEENNLYYKISIVKLIEYYNKKKRIVKIVVNDPSFKKYLKNNFCDIEFVSINNKNFNVKNVIFNFLKNIFFLIKLYFLKDKKRRIKFLKEKKIILLDIFIIKSMFKNEVFVDRYYPDLLDSLKTPERKKTFFLPAFFNSSLNFKNVKLIEKKLNFILYSDFFNFSDYFYIITILIKLYFFKVRNINYSNYQVSDLINSEIKNKSFNHATLTSVLTYTCLKKLKKNKVDIAVAIDWFENQIIDKIFNYSFTKFFPKTKLKGYMGINSDLDVNSFLIPSKYEKRYNFMPHEIYLINNYNKKFFKQIYNPSKIKMAPAYRNQKIYQYLKKKRKKLKKFTVLVIFTGSHEDNIDLIKTINAISDNLLKKIFFIFRFHNNSEIKNLIPLIDEKIKFKYSNQKSIYELLKSCNSIICRPGTTFCEALIFDIPVILTRRLYSILPAKKNTLIKNGFCHGNFEIENRLKYLINNKRNKRIINQNSVKNYFKKIELKSTKNFIN